MVLNEQSEMPITCLAFSEHSSLLVPYAYPFSPLIRSAENYFEPGLQPELLNHFLHSCDAGGARHGTREDLADLWKSFKPSLGRREHVGRTGWVGGEEKEGVAAGGSRGDGLPGLRKARVPRCRPGLGDSADGGGAALRKAGWKLFRALPPAKARGSGSSRAPRPGSASANPGRRWAAAAETPGDVTAAGRGRDADRTLYTCEYRAGAQPLGRLALNDPLVPASPARRRLAGGMPGRRTPFSDAAWGASWRKGWRWDWPGRPLTPGGRAGRAGHRRAPAALRGGEEVEEGQCSVALTPPAMRAEETKFPGLPPGLRSGLRVWPPPLLAKAMASKLLRAVILGPPGSGKGTVCQRIAQNFGLQHLSSGHFLRENIKANTGPGASRGPGLPDRGALPPPACGRTGSWRPAAARLNRARGQGARGSSLHRSSYRKEKPRPPGRGRVENHGAKNPELLSGCLLKAEPAPYPLTPASLAPSPESLEGHAPPPAGTQRRSAAHLWQSGGAARLGTSTRFSSPSTQPRASGQSPGWL
ncbi:hypothetical protein P7K49_016724 [Saguinus oedipus]|uniref:Nucleoside-diphosphate kinase n=1 Tax=Saguinus oedipus TaxID=9490 RepID=A0ABQ9VCW5_SAGOE|nr:hypothetical protein P7K49_016724 [Saguinus oedipus]